MPDTTDELCTALIEHFVLDANTFQKEKIMLAITERAHNLEDALQKSKLQKFPPDSNLPDGRYLMDGERCVTVEDHFTFYLDNDCGEYARVFNEIEDFWKHWTKPVYGPLPLEGEEEVS